jgi:hypothetical protein
MPGSAGPFRDDAWAVGSIPAEHHPQSRFTEESIDEHDTT